MHGSAALLCALSLLAAFERGGKWGYRDSSGRTVIAPRYQAAQEFSPEGIAAVVDEHGWAYIDQAGKLLIRPLVFDNGPDYFQESLARFRRDGKVGFFDRRGRVVIEARYSFALPFSEGRAAVCDGCVEVSEGEHRTLRGGRWGFIDRDGRLVVPLEFEAAESFEKGKARVRAGGRWLSILKDGKAAPR
jgi:hypothetical protein